MRQTITLIIDDSGPVNTMARHGSSGKLFVPNAFLDDFAAWAQQEGVKGKFTVLPNPLCLGQLDRGLEGLSQKELGRCLDIIREKVVPNFDITPEVLTHWWVLDLDTGKWIEQQENHWSFEQNEPTLRRYIAYATEILGRVGLVANGCTSPWDFGVKVESAYSEAVGRALKQVHGSNESWYFLHSQPKTLDVEPRVTFAGDGIRVVSVLATSGDHFWQCQSGQPARIDELLSEDGSTGRVRELFEAGKPNVLLTHWQSLFAEGSGEGLRALKKLVERIHRHLGDRLEWVTCSELAKRFS